MKSIKDGTWVRLSKAQGVPVRYQGRSGYVVGKSITKRGALRLLVEMPSRKATPLEVAPRFATAL